MYEIVLSVIHDYLVDLDKCTRPRFGQTRYEEQSYARWAAYELMFAILDNRDIHPIDVVEKFVCKMVKYSECKSEKKRIIFSIAQHVSEDILDILHAMY